MEETLVIEFQDNPLRGVPVEVKLLPPQREHGLRYGKISKPPEALRRAFAEEIPLIEQIIPKVSFFIKLYPAGQKTECDDEVAAWRMVRQSPYFHAVPAVLPKAHQARVVSGFSWECHCIVMEQAIGDKFDIWFMSVSKNVLSPPIILHQFFSTWFQLFHVLKFLHTSLPLYHGDIKPDNVMFFNNSLQFIDFNGSTQLTSDLPYGTARYVPNCVLERTRPKRRPGPPMHCGYFDLYCAGMMLLEVLVGVYQKVGKVKKPPFPSLLQYLGRKEDAEKKRNADEMKDEEMWAIMKEQNLQIYAVVKEWADRSELGARFADLLDEEKVKDTSQDVEQTYDRILGPSIQKYIGWAKEEIDFQERQGSLVGRLQGDFSKRMSQLLTNYSRNVFAHSYPLLYLDYSDHTRVYDRQAAAATRYAREILTSLEGKSCLDVGCGFGTAALYAAKAGCEQIVCLDNNPYFHRLAGLLWTQVPLERWEEYFPSARKLFEAISIYGEKHGENGEARIRNLLQEYGQMFREANADHWTYHVADYWWLGRMVTEGERFDLIICNNFLHWPIIDFERMNRDCSNYYDQDVELGRSGLQLLLQPLLKHLKPGGCLVIVEPSQFFKDDTDGEDEERHARRFTEQGVYKRAHEYAREKLAKDEFGMEWKPLPPREPKFLWSEFTRLKNCKVGLKKEMVRFGTEGMISRELWIKTIIGEFNMTLRNLTTEQLQRVSDEKLAAFYQKFQEHLERQEMPNDPPMDPTYTVIIRSPGD